MTDTVTNPKLAEVIEEARKRAGKTKFRLAVETRLSLGTVRFGGGLSEIHFAAGMRSTGGI